MKILIAVLMFFMISALIIVGNNDLEMYKTENIGKFFDLYARWLGDLFINFQGITGQAVRMEWLPG